MRVGRYSVNIQRTPKEPRRREIRLERLDGGFSSKYIQYQLDERQSPYVLNMVANEAGVLSSKRPGQVLMHQFNGQIHAMTDFKNLIIVAHGTALSSYNPSSGVTASIKTGLRNQEGTFFKLGNYLYYKNGHDFLRYNGTSCTNVMDNPYIPERTTGRSPDGATSKTLDAFNLLTGWFKDKFSGDGTSKEYKLSLTGLDEAPVTVWINDKEKAEGDGFTVDREAGTVTFTDAPPEGTNNVIIKASKTKSGSANQILKCRAAIVYDGSANDSRVFISRNEDYPNQYWYCHVNDPSYWPDENYNPVSSVDNAITGFVTFYEYLLLLMERAVYIISPGEYSESLERTIFPVAPLDDRAGCDAPKGIGKVGNMPIFTHSVYGLQCVISTDIESRQNTRPLSGNINKTPITSETSHVKIVGLLDAVNPKAAVLGVHGRQVLLKSGDFTWFWDTGLSPYVNSGNPALDEEKLSWIPWNNISAECWLSHAGELYYGNAEGGLIKMVPGVYNDFGEPINAVWRSVPFDCDLPDWVKTWEKGWITTAAPQGNSIVLRMIDENGGPLNVIQIPAQKTAKFSWADWDWSRFTWKVPTHAPNIPFSIKIKKESRLQIEISNNVVNENLSILKLIIQFKPTGKVK